MLRGGRGVDSGMIGGEKFASGEEVVLDGFALIPGEVPDDGGAILHVNDADGIDIEGVKELGAVGGEDDLAILSDTSP